jgi:hypothetical protein
MYVLSTPVAPGFLAVEALCRMAATAARCRVSSFSHTTRDLLRLPAPVRSTWQVRNSFFAITSAFQLLQQQLRREARDGCPEGPSQEFRPRPC